MIEKIELKDIGSKKFSKEDKEAFYLGLFEEARNFDSKRYTEYTELQAFYEGKQHLLTAYTEDKPWVVEINTPYASDAIDIRVASLQANDYIGELEPLSPDDVEIIEKLNMAYQNAWKEMNMDDKINNAIAKSAVVREAYVHVVLKSNETVGSKSTQRKGKFEAYFLNPASVHIDPTAVEFCDAEYVIITERMSLSVAKQLFPDIDYDSMNKTTDRHRNGEIYLGNSSDTSDNNVVTKMTIYIKNFKDKKVTQVVMIGDKLAEEKIIPIKTIPIAQLRWQKQMKSPYGLSLMDRLLSAQKAINSIESAYTNVAIAYSAPSFIVSVESNIDPADVAATAGLPGVAYLADGNIQNAIKKLTDTGVDSNLILMKQEHEETIRKIAGVTNQFEGSLGTAGNTSHGADAAIARASVIENKFLVELEKFVEDLTRITVEYLVKGFAGDTLHTRKPKNAQGVYEFETIRMPEEEELEDLEYTFGINLSVRTPFSKTKNKQQIMEIWQMENQYQTEIRTITVLDLLKTLEIPQREELIDRFNKLANQNSQEKAELITQVTQISLQYNLDPQLLASAITEIITGAKETPATDQLLQTVEQFTQQQNQVINEGESLNIEDQLMQQTAQTIDPAMLAQQATQSIDPSMLMQQEGQDLANIPDEEFQSVE